MSNLTQTIAYKKNEIAEIFSKISANAESLGIKSESLKSPYEIGRYRGSNFNVVIFSSGKILVQGKGTDSFVENFYKMTDQKDSSKPDYSSQSYKPHIGGDEVGKGDYFGPLVTCAAYCTSENYNKLLSSGAADSKKLSDIKIVQIAEKLKEIVEFEIAILMPDDYNKEIAKYKNVAIVLANLHSRSIEKLVNRLNGQNMACNEIVIDQFSSVKDRVTSLLSESSKKIPFRQFPKGESDPVIAAASILARDAFLREWSGLEGQWAMSFQKGATHVINNANEFIKLYGRDNLDKVAKVSFKTTNQLQI